MDDREFALPGIEDDTESDAVSKEFDRILSEE